MYRFGEGGGLKKIFLSSVFNEPSRKRSWPLRYQFYRQLRENNFSPWLWEQAIGSIDRIDDRIRTDLFLQGDIIKSILREQISTSDAIVTFYKNRAGSSFNAYSGMPFDATFFEIELAKKYNIPIILIMVGNTPTYHLSDTLAILDQPEIIEHRYKAKDDGEALSIAMFQLQNLLTDKKNSSFLPAYDFDRLEIAISDLDAAIATQEFGRGIEVAIQNRLPEHHAAFSKDQKFQLAQYYSKMGTVHANRRLFAEAISFLNKSIALYMDIGDEWSMTGEIQGLSGVQNMANLPSGKRTNAFGYRAAKTFSNLIDGFRDARVSMYRNDGKFEDAWRLINLDKGWVHSPYRAAKMLSVYAGRQKQHSIDFSRKMMEFEVLPWAINNGSSLYYVYMEAGNLALKQNDYKSAEAHYTKALEISNLKGALHTVHRVREMLGRIPSDNRTLL